MRQVLRIGALGRPRGMGWEGGGAGRGSGWGTHENPWLIHVNVWQKPLQYCEVISLQLIKINEKKNLRKTWIYKKFIKLEMSIFTYNSISFESALHQEVTLTFKFIF